MYVTMSFFIAALLLASDQQVVDNKPKSEAISHLETLESLLADKKYLELRKIIFNPKTPDEFSESLDWLQGNWFEGNSALIPVIYAIMLWKITENSPNNAEKQNLRSTAVASMLYFYGVIGIDGARCGDYTALVNRRDQFPTIIPDLFKYIMTMSPAEKNIVVEVAVGVEARTAARRDEIGDVEFLCAGGLEQIRYGLKNGTTKEVPAKPGQIGRQILVDDGGKYKPTTLEPKIWKPVAAKARTEMKARLESLLASVTTTKK